MWYYIIAIFHPQYDIVIYNIFQYYQCSNNAHFNLSPFLTGNYVLYFCQIFILFCEIKLLQLFFCCTIRLSSIGTLSLKPAINLGIRWSQSDISLWSTGIKLAVLIQSISDNKPGNNCDKLLKIVYLYIFCCLLTITYNYYICVQHPSCSIGI